MSESQKYENMLNAASDGREKLRLFANSLAEFEAKKGIEPRRILINGIVVDDLLSADFEVSAADTAELIEHFINIPGLDPDIIINGIPAENFRRIAVNVGRLRL